MDDLNNADHQYRQLAIRIIEAIQEKHPELQKIDGTEEYYELEDEVTKIINGHLTGKLTF